MTLLKLVMSALWKITYLQILNALIIFCARSWQLCITSCNLDFTSCNLDLEIPLNQCHMFASILSEVRKLKSYFKSKVRTRKINRIYFGFLGGQQFREQCSFVFVKMVNLAMTETCIGSVYSCNIWYCLSKPISIKKIGNCCRVHVTSCYPVKIGNFMDSISRPWCNDI